MKVKKKKKKILCPSCKTGRESYLQDENSPVCPYFSCYNGYNCAYYVNIHLNKTTEKYKGVLRKLMDVMKRH